MSKRKARQQKLSGVAPRTSQIAIAVAVVLSLFAAWTMFAYSGAFNSVFGQKRKKGGTVSTASFNSNSPSKEYIYAGGRLVATEEPGSGCSLTSAPTWTSVTTSGIAVTLVWTVPTGAALFDVQRATSKSGTFTTIAPNLTPPGGGTMSYQDNIGFVGLNTDASNSNLIVTYLYRIVAYGDSSRNCPQTSKLNVATNIGFGEPIRGLPGPQTVIKAYHATELRVAVNAVWKAADQTPATITWTDPPNGSPQGLDGYLIKAAHVDQLRSKLDQALNAINSDLVASYLDPTLTPSGTVQVKAVHFNELRQRVKGLIPN